MASRSTLPKPTDLEMQVLSVLWRRGPATVRHVLDALPDGKGRAYTTVLTIMQIMEKKGLLDHEKLGNTNIYRARVSERQVLRPMMRTLVRHVFGGRPVDAMAALLRESEVNADDLAAIRRMIDAHERRKPEEEGER